MATLLKGKDVATSINERSKKDIEVLKEKGITPCLSIFRVGEKESDLSYEKGLTKRCEELGIKLVKNVFLNDVKEEDLYNKIIETNNDEKVHGILVFRPLPKRFDDEYLRNLINPLKDVDGCGNMSLAGVFTNTKVGFAPCTAQSAIEILDYYGIDCTGKNVTVIGRSLVIGKPVSMLLTNKNATVTICHTKTKDLDKIARSGDIIICASGAMESVNKNYVKEGQVIIDVGINFNEAKGKLCGDCFFEEVEPIVEAITPVPGGVGSVTTSVLVNHVVEAAKRYEEK